MNTSSNIARRGFLRSTCKHCIGLGAMLGLPALAQTKVEVLPTRTIYTFDDAGVRLQLTFLTPALPDDIDILSRPVTYVTWEFQATDGKSHQVALNFDAHSEIAINVPEQKTVTTSFTLGKWDVTKTGSVDQQVLAKRGSHLVIERRARRQPPRLPERRQGALGVLPRPSVDLSW